MESNLKKKLIFSCGKPLQKKINIGKFEVLLPEVFGFCGGVVHAITLMERTIEEFPQKQIFILGEIIHNNNVNEYFLSKSVKIIPHNRLETVFAIVKPDDIVVIPAFGIPLELENRIRSKYKNVVDTTCKDVKRVWDFISSESKNGSTIIIHGHPFHPEVEASISRASSDAAVIVIPDKSSVENFLEGKEDSSIHIVRSDKINLSRVSLANQTTMLYSETCDIEKLLRSKIKKKGGIFNSCQTICKATYMRQSSAEKLLSKEGLDMVLVVGGYDSSNTNNLYKLSVSKKHRTFYIKDSSSFGENLVLEHFLPEKEKTVQTNLKSLFSGTRKIAILAGASCPISIVEGVIQKLSEIGKE